jgi:peptidoglycan-N-acetylglucosamine deacetylase
MRVLCLRGRTMKIAAAVSAALLLFALMLIFDADQQQAPELAVTTEAAASRLVPVYEVATENQAVAISFDASWGAEYTPLLLDILDQYQADATFFLVNIWLEDYPEMAQEIAARGHEIGLHSASHPHCTELSDDQLLAELNDNYQMVVQVTGRTPTLFRPPFGDYDSRVVELVNSCGYQCIQWSVDSLDWQDLCAEDIVCRVMKDIHAGDIVLFHNNGLHTAEALPIILEQLADRGLAVVCVSDLLLDGDCYTDVNGIQRPK